MSVLMEQMMTEVISWIQPKGDIISVEHSYALPGNRIQVENAGELVVAENGNVVMANLIDQQDFLIKTLQKQCYELLKKCSPSQRLAEDDSQTRYYAGLPSFNVFEHLLEKITYLSNIHALWSVCS